MNRQTRGEHQEHKKSVPAERIEAKEAARGQVLADMFQSPSTNTNWVTEAVLAKSKQSAVSAMMRPAKTKRPDYGKIKKKKIEEHKRARKEPPVIQKKPRKSGPTKQALEENKSVPNDKANKKMGTIVHLCGCRHGDLNAFRSFTKNMTAYYTQPNRFLEGRSCLDCGIAVTKMSATGPRQKNIVFYCDEGIKGFGAPDDDPMKKELTCDLVVCPQCEAKRRTRFDKEGAGRPSRGRKRSEQQQQRV
jgi:hypothetical protein